MAVSLSPLFNPDSAQIDSSAVPRSGAKIFTYASGTSTKVTTYQDSAGSVAHTNPIVLNSNGLPPAPIWLTQGSTYKFVLAPSTDTDPPASAILTIDNIKGINDIADIVTALAAEWVPSALAPTYVSTTSFTVATDQTTVLNVNRRIKLITTSSGTVYGTIIKSTWTSVTTVTVLLDSGTLDSGVSSLNPLGVQYGIISAANTSLPFFSRDQQCGRLVYVSATQIRLDPQDGNTIWVYTAAAGWTRRTIPSGGVTAANTNTYIDGVSGQTLSTAGATYYVYLFDNAGVLTLDFSTTAPAVDATSGLKIKTGVATRLLVGMVRVQSGSSQFGTPGLVLSWYKRRGIKVSATLDPAGRGQSSTTIIELHSEIQVKFLAWAEEAIVAQYSGNAKNDTLAVATHTKITLDGVATVIAETYFHAPVATYHTNVSLGGQTTVTEGYHYLTIGVLVGSASNGLWLLGTLFVETQG